MLRDVKASIRRMLRDVDGTDDDGRTTWFWSDFGILLASLLWSFSQSAKTLFLDNCEILWLHAGIPDCYVSALIFNQNLLVFQETLPYRIFLDCVFIRCETFDVEAPSKYRPPQNGTQNHALHFALVEGFFLRHVFPRLSSPPPLLPRFGRVFACILLLFW